MRNVQSTKRTLKFGQLKMKAKTYVLKPANGQSINSSALLHTL